MAYNISRKGCFKCGNRASLLPFSLPPSPSSSSFLFSARSATLFTGPLNGWVGDANVLSTTVGHIAENCTSHERLCYNCRKPGHESSTCTEPRTVAAKQCYSCGGIGHIQAECPTLRLQGSNQKCYVRAVKGNAERLCETGFWLFLCRIAAILGISRACVPTTRYRTLVLRRARRRRVVG